VATTDAAGEVAFAGAARTPYAVRALGPGHRPVLAPPQALDDGSEPIVLVVDVGASLFGTFGPADVLAALGPTADETRLVAAMGERGAQMLASWMPVLVLRPLAGGRTFPERAADGAVAPDGSFRIDGVPPGSYDVLVRHRLPGAARGATGSLATRLATVRDLRAGEPRQVDLQAPMLRLGRLVASVTVDGELLRNHDVRLRYRRDGLGFGDVDLPELTAPLTIGALGRIAVDVPPGTWGLEVMVPRAGGAGTALLRCETFAEVAPGGTAEVTFALQRRALRVRVLGADGAPVVGRRFSVLQDRYLAGVGATDAAGWLVLDPVLPGRFELATWPPELADQEAQTTYIRAHPFPQWMDVLVRLGPLGPVVGAGPEAEAVELRLPR
jgi:hypothetical protein